jgi:hypothetical protein
MWAFKNNYPENQDVAYRKQVHVHIGILLSIFLILACTKSMRADPSSPKHLSVELGREFELEKGQRARVAGTGLELANLDFLNCNSPSFSNG